MKRRGRHIKSYVHWVPDVIIRFCRSRPNPEHMRLHGTHQLDEQLHGEGLHEGAASGLALKVQQDSR